MKKAEELLYPKVLEAKQYQYKCVFSDYIADFPLIEPSAILTFRDEYSIGG
jgi:hypothetical protein